MTYSLTKGCRPFPRTSLLLLVVLLLLLTVNAVNSTYVVNVSAQATGEITQSWLNTESIAWNTTKAYPLNFAVLFRGLSYGNILQPYQNISDTNAELNMLLQTGAQSVRIDIDYDLWLKNETSLISVMDNYIKGLETNGTKVIIADAAAESYRTAPIPWAQFKSAWIQRVQFLAARYHPYMYVVIKEPGWYLSMISDASSNPLVQNTTEWANLTLNLTEAVKQVSPNTKVGVAIPGNMFHEQTNFDANFFQKASHIPSLDFVGLDIYTMYGFTDSLSYIQQFGSGGKNVWITEAWSTTGNYAFNQTRVSLDTSWIKVLYEFALTIHAQGLMPFYTDIFASYSQSPDNSTELLSYYQTRTPVFYAFQDIIAQNKLAVYPSTTSTSSTTTSTTFHSTSTSHSTTSSATSISTSSAKGGGGKGQGINLPLLTGVVTVILILGVVFYVVVRYHKK